MAYLEEQINARQLTETEKPVVFLIGDSMRMGYCEIVKKELADVADVVYPEENCRYSQYIISGLRGWSGLCDPQKVALVQFNCGHWDVAHWNDEDVSLNSPEIYRHNIVRIINSLRRIYPNARVIFATSTPMNPDGSNSPNFRTTQELAHYNEVAADACRQCGVTVNDLFALTRDWDSACYADYCHFTPEAFARLGRHVADVLRSKL